MSLTQTPRGPICIVGTPGHRELKFARTRLAMLNALLEFLAHRPFAEISINEIAGRAGVSYATFFNYFSRKDDLLHYLIQLWSLELSHAAGSRKGLAGIEEIFRRTAAQCRKSPAVMAQIVATMASRPEAAPGGFEPVTRAEKVLWSIDIADSKDRTESGIADIFARLLKEASAGGEIPRHTDLRSLTEYVTTVFFGVPAALGPTNAESFERMYTSHLSFLWNAIQIAPGPKAKRKR